MKKLVSVVLVLVMVLALGATAFADTGIYVTKNPTDEVRTAGGTAWFISGATNYNTLSWTFMSPDGTKYSVQDFKTRFPYATVEGEYTTTLTVRNLNTDMNRWGVFCTFSNNNGSTDTAMAFLYVSAYAAPTYSQPAYTAPSYNTNVNTANNGPITSLTNLGDGAALYTCTDGSMNYVGEDGSYMNVSADGFWFSYDASTGTYEGGMFNN